MIIYRGAMDDSAPSERDIPYDTEAYKDDSDWYITRYTWQEYLQTTLNGEKQTTVEALPGYAYYVYIRVVALDSNGVSQSKQSVYAFFCIEFPFFVVRETLLQCLKQHVRVLWNCMWWYGMVWHAVSYRLYSTRGYIIRLRVETYHCCCCDCCSLNDNHYHCHCCYFQKVSIL